MFLAVEPVEPDPSLVTPGALGLLITVLMVLACVLLYRSMRKQLGRIDFEETGADSDAPQPTER